ncbi:MAG: Gfo/Idh/MocA family protein, partial [Gammaproteobacteria bacterium]
LQSALNTHPDAVFITTPNAYHAPAVLQCMERAVPVFCEKPLATSLAQASRVRDAVRRAGVVFQMGHNRRFTPAYRACRRILTQGLKPYSASIIKNDAHLRQPAWGANPAQTGGLLYNGTVHALDAALWLLGTADEVYCTARSGVYPDLDNLSLTLRFSSGAVATVSTCGHASGLRPSERLAIYGDHAAVVLEDLDSVSHAPGPDQPIVAYDFRQLPMEQRWGYAQEDLAFVDALSGESAVEVGIEEGYRVVELIEACYRSAREGRPVLVSAQAQSV